MEKQFIEVCSKLGNIHEIMDNLEQRQKSLEDEMKMLSLGFVVG